MLYVVEVNYNDTIFQCPIGCGKNYGNKTMVGDYKTPEGDFFISNIYDATEWTHDFKDGKGIVKGAYGPYFFRLKVSKFNSIGIHGTCFPNSIGSRCSEGCIRLRNEDIHELYKYVYKNMPVMIEPD